MKVKVDVRVGDGLTGFCDFEADVRLTCDERGIRVTRPTEILLYKTFVNNYKLDRDEVVVFYMDTPKGVVYHSEYITVKKG